MMTTPKQTGSLEDWVVDEQEALNALRSWKRTRPRQERYFRGSIVTYEDDGFHLDTTDAVRTNLIEESWLLRALGNRFPIMLWTPHEQGVIRIVCPPLRNHYHSASVLVEGRVIGQDRGVEYEPLLLWLRHIEREGSKTRVQRTSAVNPRYYERISAPYRR